MQVVMTVQNTSYCEGADSMTLSSSVKGHDLCMGKLHVEEGMLIVRLVEQVSTTEQAMVLRSNCLSSQ